MRKSHICFEQRAYSLVEAVIVVAVLAIAIPPGLISLRETTTQRAESVGVTRATSLASAVMEQVIADVTSDDASLGFAALSDMSVYVDAAGVGLRDRVDGVASGAESVGLSYTVSASALVSIDGAATGNPAEDLFRIVTVSVVYPSPDGDRTLELQALLGDD
ncbi:MAG: hypothetical protein AAGB51_09255 [Planctomycetota bacterium]